MSNGCFTGMIGDRRSKDRVVPVNPYNGAHARTLPAPCQAANPAKYITTSTTTKAHDHGPRATTTVKPKPRHPHTLFRAQRDAGQTQGSSPSPKPTLFDHTHLVTQLVVKVLHGVLYPRRTEMDLKKKKKTPKGLISGRNRAVIKHLQLQLHHVTHVSASSCIIISWWRDLSESHVYV